MTTPPIASAMLSWLEASVASVFDYNSLLLQQKHR